MSTYTAIALVVFGDRRLAHGSCVNWKFRLLDELRSFLANTMSDGASIKENDGVVVGFLNQLNDFVKDVAFDLSVILGRLDVEGCEKTLAGDLLVNEIGGEHEVGGATEDDTFCENTINLSRGGGYILKRSVGDSELLGSDVVCVETTISESVVEHGLRLLLSSGGDTDEVEDGDVLGEGTGDTVRGAQLTDTKGGEQNTDAALLDTSIAVSSVGSVEFVTARGDQLHRGTRA